MREVQMMMVLPTRTKPLCLVAALLLLVMLLIEVSSSSQQSGQLTAAEIDDNLNFESYLLYQENAKNEINSQYLPFPNLSGRVVVQVVDGSGQAARGTAVQLLNTNKELPVGTNGKISLFPNEFDDLTGGIQAKTVGGSCPEDCSPIVLPPSSTGRVSSETPELQIPVATTAAPTMLDVALIVDTTSSMCDEMSYLKAEMKDVIQRVVSSVASTQDGDGGGVDVRVAYVAYKDTQDSFVVQTRAFTTPDSALAAFEDEVCSGGGDFPEAIEQALNEAATALQWRTSGSAVRVALVVADAPPHDENMPEALQAALKLRELGVRVYGLAGSSAAEKTEYLMRLMAILTGAWHLWLTDDSGIGNPHSTPTVPCYKVQYLNALLVRALTTELTGERVEAVDDGVIREVGQQERGVCLVGLTPAPTPSPTTPGPTIAPVSSTGGDTMSGEGDSASRASGGDDGSQICLGRWSVGTVFAFLVSFFASLWHF